MPIELLEAERSRRKKGKKGKKKTEGLFICEDLSQVTLEKRKPQQEKLKAAKQAGKSAYLTLDRLIIRDKPSGSSKAANSTVSAF